MSKQTLLLSLIALIVGSLIAVFTIRFQIQSHPPLEFHEHADFAMFIEGERFDFSLEQFMSDKPCSITQANPSWVDIAQAHSTNEGLGDLTDFVHLHDGNPNNVHSHKEGMTYGDLFTSIKMDFDDTLFIDHQGNRYENNESKSWRMFINNEEVAEIANKEIRDLERILFTYGPRDRSEQSIKNELVQVSHDACIYSLTCTHRGAAPLESCGDTSSVKPKFLEWLGVKFPVT